MSKDSFGDIPGTRTAVAHIPALGADAATIVYPIFRAPDACIVTAVNVVPQAAFTGATGACKNLNIIDAGTAGVGSTEVGNLDMITGVNFVALDSKNIPLNATYLAPGVTMVEGDTLVLQIEDVGTSPAFPAIEVYVEYKIT